MTIVATDVRLGEYLFALTVFVFLTAICVISVLSLIYLLIDGGFDAVIAFYAIALLMLAVLCGVVVYGTQSKGPDVIVHAIVDDWNAVHDAGYEVIEQQGDSVTLRKAQP